MPSCCFFTYGSLCVYFTSSSSSPTRMGATTNFHSNAKRKRSSPFENQDDTEREIKARAKRLARFSEELTEHPERNKVSGVSSMESAAVVTNCSIPSDVEFSKTSSIVSGLCQDMCPVPEREERERKGGLDQYERLDGDRNQTNEFLAVKKYTRRAEKEANLIRPMPVLQKTIDYLLTLLDHPYDDKFLGMYDFLWDRMRAIRMDLRMQSIFNEEAITMLEQMIRLHIIAMHELCEHTKGEGFSKGFDAHLNVEQMNKTSVELFQMYDDQRKKGINVPSEKEFRGYYALLKLDKHPGYKVEPAELSLDLAMMTPEIRQTPELLFARDVARACRTSNFIAFFRLARKASYLQACLMHAHFSKLRKQAFTSLHSSLQKNQGLPITHVAKWLALEEEDIESLIEYHGFVTKEFEEPYMIKEGPFLNDDQDFPTKRSKLVDQKKSGKIADDVSPALPPIEIQQPKLYNREEKTMSVREMPAPQVVSSPMTVPKLQPRAENLEADRHRGEDHQLKGDYIPPWGFSVVQSTSISWPTKHEDDEKLDNVPEKITPPEMQQVEPQEGNGSPNNDNVVDKYIVSCSDTKETDCSDSSQDNVVENLEEEIVGEKFEDEVALAKLKLIIRLWKRRSTKRRKFQEQKRKLANAALSFLPMGPLICKTTHRCAGGLGLTSRPLAPFLIEPFRPTREEVGKKTAVPSPNKLLEDEMMMTIPTREEVGEKKAVTYGDETAQHAVDKLSKLLEKINSMQNNIDKKLYVYF